MINGNRIVIVLLFHLVSIECSQNHSFVDVCNSCLGENSSCRVVAGIFTRQQLDVGYNLVAHIPRSACSLNITEIRRSPNHLALRYNKNSTFILNGNWRLSQTGTYAGAGAVFHYRRQDLTFLEAIISPGPLHEPVDLLVLHQQQNPGIMYEYKLPPLVSKSGKGVLPIALAPRHKPQVDSDLLTTTLKSRSSSMLQQDSFASTSSSSINNKNKIHRHLHFAKPVSVSQIHKNIYYWKIVGYTNCSQNCGGGVQRSIIHCVRSAEETGTVLVSERYCLTEEKPLEQRIRCNIKPCPAEWVMGDWSECTGECGEGLMTRQVHCQQRVTPTLKMRVNEGACLDEKPEKERKCKLNKRCNLWVTSEWGPCSETCGNGVRRREVNCKEINGKCDEQNKPNEVKPCNMGPCFTLDDDDGLWMASEWGKTCSMNCGKGIETRHVACAGKSGNTKSYYGYTYESEKGRNATEFKAVLIRDENAIEPEIRFSEGVHNEPMCNYADKPAEERECFNDKGCGNPEWFIGDWGMCSSTCDTGYKTRQVLCVQFIKGKFKVLSEQACSAENKPSNKETCKNPMECPPMWFATEWNECSALCGGGVQQRVVICRNVNASEAKDSCNDEDKPVEKRTCNVEPCSAAPITMNTTSNENQSNTKNVFSNSSTDDKREDGVNLSEENNDIEPGCSDEYRNCALVLQARLCRYKYYRAVCCRSCSQSMHFSEE